MRSIAVVGGSLAGLSAARALRSQGFDGVLSVVSDEVHRPYDRPPLSKGFLSGALGEADLGLESEGEDLGVDWRDGVRATALDPVGRSVYLSDGSRLVVDAVVLATGASPRTMWPQPPRGVHVLRTLDDALALRADLVPGVRVVVVGAGFIGAEVASTASSMGLDVTVIEAARTALAGPLGLQMGQVVSALHSDSGVRLLCGVGVVGLSVDGVSDNGRLDPRSGSTGRVTGIELADGSFIGADVVVVGVGVRPNVDWLAGSGLDISNGVLCDDVGATGIAEVVAVGDCATWFRPALGRHSRLEHWTGARERGAIASAALLSGGLDRRTERPPYFWSDQYGVKVQMTGHIDGADSVQIEEGSADARDFLAVYRHEGEAVAVLAMGHATSFMRWRRHLAAASALRSSVPAASVSISPQPVPSMHS